jgi:predicted dehydrogenase
MEPFEVEVEMKVYRAALIGCSRMGAFIDNEVAGSATTVLPYSHAAGYEASPRTELVACADLRPEVMAEVGKRYGIPPERQYPDFRALIDKERPEIVSVATQPEQRAEIVIYAAEHGARAIYAEKAMAASMAEADAMVAAVERHGVFLNMGTNRRWDSGYDRMKELIDGGEMGALKTIILYATGSLFNTASHWLDLALRLNSDHRATAVQAYLPGGGNLFDGDRLLSDPNGEGTIWFENGAKCYALLTPRGSEVEAILERGALTAMSNGASWRMRRQNAADHRGRGVMTEQPFPAYERTSSTANLIADLVNALDTGQPPRGGVRVAHASTELIFAFIESHRRGGARIELPLRDSRVRLQRDVAPRTPKFAA